MFEDTHETNHYQLIVDKKIDNKKIRDILINRGFSSRLISTIKKYGKLLKNGEEVFFIEEASAGDVIDVFLPNEKLNIKPVEGDIDIIYEDSEILVVNKPTMLVTHPTQDYQENTLGNYIANYFDKTNQKVKVRFVNRLDRDTTGLIVVAKNKFVHHYIQSRMNTDEVQKTYTAFAEGIPEEEEFLIDKPIYRPEQESIKRIVDERGKKSQTDVKLVEKLGNNSKLECKLLTGRTHQIRVHLESMGLPLIGDPLYNPDSKIEFNRQALHARRLELTLPKKGKIVLEAPISEDLIQLESQLKGVAE